MRDSVIVEQDIDQLAEEAKALVADVREAEAAVEKLERQVGAARDAALARRLELGRLLIKARKRWPERGPKAKGWGEFLRRIGVDDSTAWRWIQGAGGIPGSGAGPGGASDTRPHGPDFSHVRENSGPSGPDAPHPADAGGPDGGLGDHGGAQRPDRDSYCTPAWITDAIGRWDLDPCGNERSHVQADAVLCLEHGHDGLEYAAGVPASVRVFVNPPYSDVMPWVQAYRHARFCFIVKFDPSTRWCAALLERTELVLFPRRTRIEFEPPPGIPGDGGNQFPHGLFFARAEDATPEIRALCFEFRVPPTKGSTP